MFTLRQRMERLEERTKGTVLPPIEDLFRKEEANPTLTKEFVEHMSFSKYPGTKEFSASALKAMLHNTNNLEELRSSGVMGSIIEAVRRIDLKKEEEVNGTHVAHLVESLHVLTENDENMLTRLVSHPSGTRTVIRLCRSLRGKLQALCFDILEWIHQMIDGPKELLNYDILKTLLSPTFLFKKTTLMDVRHRACHLISQLTPKAPMLFDVEIMNMLMLDPKTGKRRVDGYMEMQLLTSFLVHMAWRQKVGRNFLPFIFTMISHLLNEVMGESFESVEHMQQIMRIAVILSRDPKHADYMWTHRLDAALQYLVKTDFSLYRRKAETTSGSQSDEKAKLDKIKNSSVGKAKRKSILDSGERTPSTLMFLSLVKPDAPTGSKSATRNEDINFFCTRYVVILYENVMNIRMEIVHDLVSSGVVGALLFRVGKGTDRNPRFNKLVTHFLHQILQKIMLYQPHMGYHMALLPSSAVGRPTKLHCYMQRGDSCPPPPPEFLVQQEELRLFNGESKASEGDDVRAITPSTAANSRANSAAGGNRARAASGDSNAQDGREDRESGDNSSVLSSNTAANAVRGRAGSILAEALAMQAEEVRKGKARAAEQEKQQRLTIQIEQRRSGPPPGGLGSPQPSGFTPGPGFRKRLQNTSDEYNFPTDTDGNALYPPASPMSPLGAGPRFRAEGTTEGGSVLTVGTGTEGELDDGGTLTAPVSVSVVPFGGGEVEGGAEGQHSLLDGEVSAFGGSQSVDSEYVREIHRKKIMAQSTDLRSISNTLTAQGSVENFFATLMSPATEEQQIVKEALVGVAVMDFNTFHAIATEARHLTALFQVYRQRHDLFFPFLHILCEMIQSYEVDDAVIVSLVTDHRCLVMLLQALHMSGWHFHRKEQVYKCFGKLSQVCGQVFYDHLSDCGGIPVLCREVELRKLKTRQGRRGAGPGGGEDEGDGTELLMPVLRRDIAACKIQAQARRRRAARRVGKVRAEHEQWQAFLHGEKEKKAKEEAKRLGLGSPSRKKQR